MKLALYHSEVQVICTLLSGVNAYILKAINEKMGRDEFDGYLHFAAEEG
ncbi:hypothetical protein YDYSG_59730 [Paenibacillus tyrfis]|nr:hypothetical protein [Paenibacillus tyrfis]GLI09940.1 hypothetical protein YDYSG_59730 [Paenibacillus tyrfis]